MLVDLIGYRDQVVLDIIKNNLGDRPICYSVTVPENSRAGLNKYLIFEGMTARVTPFEQPPDNTGIGGSVQPVRYAASAFHYPTKAHAEPDRGTILHSYSDPSSHLSAMDEEYAMTYRSEFIRLSNWYLNHNDPANARRALDTMEARVPIGRIDMDYSFASFIADLADKSGDWPLLKKYAAFGAQKLRDQLRDADFRENASGGMDPEYQLANLEMRAGNLATARKEFEALRGQAKPQQAPFFQLKIDEVDARQLEAEKKYDTAYRKFSQILNSYAPSQASGQDLQDLRNHVMYDSLQRAHDWSARR